MQETRRQRLQSAIQEELAQFVSREVKDPRIPMVTFTEVQVTQDGSHATIFVSILGSGIHATTPIDSDSKENSGSGAGTATGLSIDITDNNSVLFLFLFADDATNNTPAGMSFIIRADNGSANDLAVNSGATGDKTDAVGSDWYTVMLGIRPAGDAAIIAPSPEQTIFFGSNF